MSLLGGSFVFPARRDIDLAGGAGAGPAAIGIDAGDQVLDRAFHQRPALRHLDGVRLAVVFDIGDLEFLPRHHAICFMGMEMSARVSAAIFVAVRHQLLADHIFRRGIDRFHRRHRAVAQMEDGEFAGRRDRRAAPACRWAAPGRRSAASGHTGRTRTTALRYRSWACPPSPAPHAWPGRWRSARIPAGCHGLRARHGGCSRPPPRYAGSPVLAFWSTTMPSFAGKPGRRAPIRHRASRRCRPARCRRDSSGRRRCTRSHLAIAFDGFDAGVAASASRRPFHARRHRRPTGRGDTARAISRSMASNTVTSSPRLAPTAATSSPI